MQAEVDTWDVTRLQAGINPFGFEWKLQPGESFTSPEAILVYSDKGLNHMSQTFHQLFNEHLIQKKLVQKKDRPVLLNNWEATYFNFNENKLVNIAKQAKKTSASIFLF